METLPDGKTLVYPRRDRIIFWDMEANTEQSLSGHLDDVRGIVLTPDGKRLISGSGDGTIKIWKVP